MSRESLRFKLASNILASSVQPNRTDFRLRDSERLLSNMHEYNITDLRILRPYSSSAKLARLRYTRSAYRKLIRMAIQNIAD